MCCRTPAALVLIFSYLISSSQLISSCQFSLKLLPFWGIQVEAFFWHFRIYFKSLEEEISCPYIICLINNKKDKEKEEHEKNHQHYVGDS